MKYRNRIAPYWRNVGLYLLEERNEYKLGVIRKDYSSDAQSCCHQMLKYWLAVDVEASWNKLIHALLCVDLTTIADRIRQDILLGKVY